MQASPSTVTAWPELVAGPLAVTVASPAAGAAIAALPAVPSAHGCHEPSATLHEGRPAMGMHSFTSSPRYTWGGTRRSRVSRGPRVAAEREEEDSPPGTRKAPPWR